MTTPSEEHAMRMPGAKACGLSFSAPACALFLALLAVSCGSAERAEERDVQGGQAKTANSRDEVATHVIEITGFKFVPDVLTVKKGDRIVWKNLDIVPHTATAGDKRWDSGSIANNAQYAATIEQTGQTDYICSFHPAMKARLVIEE